ncbi:hypothetical protein PFISCL1PPCAC_2157, partial [Pristionchus fissidentatus]
SPFIMAPASNSSQQLQQHLAPGDLLRVLHAAQPQRLAAAAPARRVIAATDVSMAPATRHDGRWIVPAEIVGLDSKKSKQAKIKFHPSSLEMARSDEGVAAAVQKAVDDIIGIVTMDGMWRTNAAVSNNEIGSTAAKLRRLFTAVQPQLIVRGEIVLLSWPLHTTPSTSKNAAKAIKEACALLTGQAKMPLRARVRSESSGEKEEKREEEMGGGDAVMRDEKGGEKRQMVEMECSLGGGSHSVQVWRLEIEGGAYLVEENDEKKWREPEIQLTSRCLSLRLRRSLSSSEMDVNLPPRLPSAPTAAVREEEKNKEKRTMVDAMQCRVEELRRKLDDSLAAFQKLSQTRGQQRETQRKIVVLSADRTETAIEICEANARPRVRPLAASTPLQVMVADGASGAVGDAAGGGLAGSPTESIDSGISNPSPSSSPSAVSPKASPFYQYSEESSTNAKLAMRSRSLSESASYSPIQMTPTLRGILKKTPMREYGRPLRGLFKRSLSESADSSPFFVLRSMNSFEEEPLEEIDEEDEDEAIEIAQEALPLQPRAKRVSFSENLVQKRSFRPSCSIVWHQQKAAKKNAKRDLRSRTMSEGDANPNMWDEDEDERKTLVPEEEMGIEEKSGTRDTRKDSGFCEDDDDVIVSEGEEAGDEAEIGEAAKTTKPSSPFSSSLRTAPSTKSAAFTIGGPAPSTRDWLRAATMRAPRTRIASASN